MKIAVTSTGSTLDSQLDPRFGRAAYFIIVDADTLQFDAIENDNTAAPGGAGVNAAKLVADQAAEAVITGNCGPNPRGLWLPQVLSSIRAPGERSRKRLNRSKPAS